jgi:hypothetical protein
VGREVDGIDAMASLKNMKMMTCTWCYAILQEEARAAAAEAARRKQEEARAAADAQKRKQVRPRLCDFWTLRHAAVLSATARPQGNKTAYVVFLLLCVYIQASQSKGTMQARPKRRPAEALHCIPLGQRRCGCPN